ncbi:MAG: glycosyltransferase involved in cell wall biosynthesis [Colwellia sp.]|jgi:glycosyltransferase involved in cell wall biosynthesis
MSNNKNKPVQLSIVIPCYNEEEVLPETVTQMTALVNEMIEEELVSENSAVWFVDDGSKDKTWQMIEEYSHSNSKVKGIKLSRNKGHQNALLAGLETADGDLLVSIDADLQDDITVIRDMVKEYYNGHDVVYGVRKVRTTDTVFKRTTAQGFYTLIQKLGVDVIYNHADFRLMSRRAIEALKEHKEVNLFLRGMIPLIGFSSTNVEYTRTERFAGESKYPLKKMLALAVDGITSFSAYPLRLIAGLGFTIFLFSIFISCWVFYTLVFTDSAIPGWASSVLPMYLLGGIQLLSIGVVGEYVGKIYMESKQRPRYVIEKVLANK